MIPLLTLPILRHGIKKCKTAGKALLSNSSGSSHLSSVLVDELGDLADGNGLTLITEGESTEGGVFGEGLDTDTTDAAGDLQAGDDAHTLGGEAGCFLGFSAGTLLEFVKESLEGNFFCSGVHWIVC